MKKRTPFYDLAEKIINNDGKNENGFPIFCCIDLKGKERELFIDFYLKDAIKSNKSLDEIPKDITKRIIPWMSDYSDGRTREDCYNHRATALLLLHEITTNP